MHRKKTVLCVEKGGVRAKARCSTLKRAGYEVISAENVADALKIFVSQTIDAVVLDGDYSSGKKDSPEVLMGNIRPYVPVILMRGQDSQIRRRYSAQIFRKRDGNRVLLRVLEDVLSSSSGESATAGF